MRPQLFSISMTEKHTFLLSLWKRGQVLLFCALTELPKHPNSCRSREQALLSLIIKTLLQLSTCALLLLFHLHTKGEQSLINKGCITWQRCIARAPKRSTFCCSSSLWGSRLCLVLSVLHSGLPVYAYLWVSFLYWSFTKVMCTCVWVWVSFWWDWTVAEAICFA